MSEGLTRGEEIRRKAEEWYGPTWAGSDRDCKKTSDILYTLAVIVDAIEENTEAVKMMDHRGG